MRESQKMELAIFWLPLIAGLLLGGLSVGAWYGGDKTLAIWVGFIGVVCFLLTGTLQVQQRVWRAASQPNISLLPPTEQYFLRWDPPKSYQMQTNDHPTPVYGAWKVPTLKIRNSGSFAQDGTIRWSTTPFEIKALIDSSPRFKAHRAIVEDNRVTFGPESGPGTFFQHSFLWSVTVPLPFISRENDIFIPVDVWQNAALFFIATLPDEHGSRSTPFFFDVQVSWNIPEGGQPKVFRVKAVAVNAKPPGVTTPDFLATLEISVPNSNE